MEATGKANDKKKFFIARLRGDRAIWLVLLAFMLISLVVVYSSSSALAYRHGTSTLTYLTNQLTFFIIGFVFLLICYGIPLRWYRRFSVIGIIVAAILLVIPIVMGGDPRRISLPGMSIQPSEFAKIAVVLYLARVLETSYLNTFKEYVLKVLIPLGIICLLCLVGSVSATLIIGVVSLVILICAGMKWKYIWYTVGIMIAALAIVWTINSFTDFFPRLNTFQARIERFAKGQHEEMSAKELQEYKEKTFQSEQAIEAIQLGKIRGRGPGNSIKRETLPNAYDDYIFASIVEEYGFIGGSLILLLYLWFFFRCLKIANSCNKPFSTIVVLGLSLLIVMQAFLHIMVNVGILPVTGQTLPMISQGGTSIVILSGAFGIILSVNRTIEVKVELEKKMTGTIEQPTTSSEVPENKEN